MEVFYGYSVLKDSRIFNGSGPLLSHILFFLEPCLLILKNVKFSVELFCRDMVNFIQYI